MYYRILISPSQATKWVRCTRKQFMAMKFDPAHPVEIKRHHQSAAQKAQSKQFQELGTIARTISNLNHIRVICAHLLDKYEHQKITDTVQQLRNLTELVRAGAIDTARPPAL